jgi:hypothetical protein
MNNQLSDKEREILMKWFRESVRQLPTFRSSLKNVKSEHLNKTSTLDKLDTAVQSKS